MFLYFNLCLSVMLNSLMFIYIHILSYYKLFLYFNLCLSLMLNSLIFIYIHILSYYKLFLYFHILSYYKLFLYFHILSYYKLFLYFNLCVGVILDSILCSCYLLSEGITTKITEGPPWSWSYRSCEIYKFEYHSWWCLLDTPLSDKVCQWLAAGCRFLWVLWFPLPIKLTTTT